MPRNSISAALCFISRRVDITRVAEFGGNWPNSGVWGQLCSAARLAGPSHCNCPLRNKHLNNEKLLHALAPDVV